MEAFLPDSVKAVLLVVLVIVFAFGWLARKHPEVAWLQAFRPPAMSEEQKARRRRAANRMAGLEIIGAGLALALLYIVSTVMMFNDFKLIPTIIVGACSLLCIALGLWILVRPRS